MEEEEIATSTTNIFDNDDAPLSSLPEKSKKAYEKQNELFNKWAKENKIEEITEEVVLAYFWEISENKKSSTLWTVYSMLKATLLVANNIDISRFKKLQAFLKRQAVGYKANKTSTFKREEINKFLSEASDDHYLMMKVAVIIGIAGACSRDELTQLSIDDIEDKDTTLIIRIRDSQTGACRTFTVSNGAEEDSIDLLSIYRKYAALRPLRVGSRRFFVKYGNGKCSAQVVGKHTFGKIPSIVAQYLNLLNPASYTGHSFRKSKLDFSEKPNLS